jgi:hypothetical protein
MKTLINGDIGNSSIGENIKHLYSYSWNNKDKKNIW